MGTWNWNLPLARSWSCLLNVLGCHLNLCHLLLGLHSPQRQRCLCFRDIFSGFRSCCNSLQVRGEPGQGSSGVLSCGGSVTQPRGRAGSKPGGHIPQDAHLGYLLPLVAPQNDSSKGWSCCRDPGSHGLSLREVIPLYFDLLQDSPKLLSMAAFQALTANPDCYLSLHTCPAR